MVPQEATEAKETAAANARRTGKRQNLLVKGIPKEINMIAQKQLNSVSYARIFQTPINVSGHRLQAMVDSGATGNFMSQSLLDRKGLPIRKKDDAYDLMVIDGNPLPSGDGRVVNETTPLPVATQQHYEELTFDVVRMASHEIVLGMPWLRKHNPTIDWTKRLLKFERCNCVIAAQPAHRQSSMVDEKQNLEEIARRELAASNKNDPITEFGSTDTGLGQTGHEVRVSEGSHVPSETLGKTEGEIPDEYRAWKDLFREEVTAAVLPIHQPWDHEIKLEPGKQPTFGPIYALSEKELEALRKYLDENMKKGFIRKSQSPAGYPILFVPMKDGTLRLCVDYRKLNNITVKNRYPLPNIGELQTRLGKAKYFTKLDLRGAYNLIRMKEGEEWKTAFRTRYGHYEYQVMPFGLTNAPATCQEMINDTLRKYLDIFVIAYLDDILIYSESLKEHVQHVQRIFECLKERNLKLKPEKCEFHKKEVNFLGFIIGQHGIRIDPEKIKAVREWKAPTNIKELQSFLGFVNYNRKFIKDYSRKAVPLTRLTAKDVTWSWKPEQEAAFRELQQACVDEPVLKMFDGRKAIRIETDASDLAIGACLS